jgi:hypothetical protein
LFVEAMLHFGGVSSSQSQMLALTDSQLAHLAIAATRIDPRHRGQWLRAIAAKLDPPTLSCEQTKSRTPAARRQARVRARRKNGVQERPERSQRPRGPQRLAVLLEARPQGLAFGRLFRTFVFSY